MVKVCRYASCIEPVQCQDLSVKYSHGWCEKCELRGVELLKGHSIQLRTAKRYLV